MWWVGVRPNIVTAADVAVWTFSFSMLVKIVAFLGTLHWPAHAGNLGWEVSLLWNSSFYMNFGLENGLFLRELPPRYWRARRPISVSAVPRVPGVDF